MEIKFELIINYNNNINGRIPLLVSSSYVLVTTLSNSTQHMLM